MGRVRDADEVAARRAKKEAKKAERAAGAAVEVPPAKRRKVSIVTAEDAKNALSVFRTRLAQGVRLADQLNAKRSGFNEALRDVWKAMTKQERKAIENEDKDIGTSSIIGQADISYPFHVEASDHCETSLEAFADVAPILELFAERLGKSPAKLAVWDPYYCAGSSKRHLAQLGFERVHNKCEDFYAVIKNGSEPQHDIVVTNPPYSEPKDGGPPHAARLFRFLTGRDRDTGCRPFLVCMPEYCANAAYYSEEFPNAKEAPLLLCPYRRYHFWTPEGSRPGRNKNTHRKKGLGVRNSPFVALWYVKLEPIITRRELLHIAKVGALRGVDTYGTSSSGAASLADGAAEGLPRCRLCRRLEGLPAGRERFKGADQGKGYDAAAGAGHEVNGKSALTEAGCP